MLRLWKYDTTTGYWKVVRSVTPETKDDWLRIWKKDDPSANYVVSASTPRIPKSQAKDLGVEYVLYGLPKGATERWQEVLLTGGPNVTPESVEQVKKLAAADGFHSFRVAKINLSKPPDFKGTVRKAKDSVLTFSAFIAALLAWYDAQQDVERNQAANYDLTKYRPKPKAF